MVAAQLVAGRFDDREDAEHQRDRDQHRAGEVGALVQADPVRSRPAAATIGDEDADRQVDDEDPVPADRLGDDAAGDQPDRASGGGDEREDADRFRLVPAGSGTSSRSCRGSPRRPARRRPPARSARRSASPGTGQAAQSSEAAVKTASPRGRRRRWPIRSPSPPGQQQKAAEGDHVGVDHPGELRRWEKPRSSWIVGSATLTIVASSTIISMPAQST